MKFKKFTITLTVTLVLLLSFSVFASEGGEKRTVVDMVGRKVKLPEKVERVITTYTPATQFIMALGADQRLVAGPSGLPNQKIFTLINEDIKDLPIVGSKNKGVNIEAVMEADPDLVILFPHEDGIETAKKLKNMGVASLVINPESFSEIRECNMLLGKALNLEEKAKKIDDEYEKILKLAKRTNDISEENKKEVYFANSELLDTVGESLLQTDLIELAGAVNPAKTVKKGFIKTSAEELIKWDPDLIIVSQFYRESIDKLKDNKKFQSIKAFENDDIYRIPSNLEPWDFPSPSSALIVPWLAQNLYPEKYEDISVKKIINDFYKTLYGKSYSDFQGELN